MEFILSPEAWMSAGLIFAMRVSDMTLDTLRVLFVMRGRKGIAWVLSFFCSLIFVLAIGTALSNMDNPLNVIGYAAGFATGNVVGMFVEEKLAIGHILLTIVSPRRGAAITERLRAESFALTELPGRGKDGAVALLNCTVQRKHIEKVRQIVNEIDPDAFITASDIRSVRRGFWRG